MAIDKPTKPIELMPRSFGGLKNNFSEDLQTSGFEPNIPQTYNGDNLNYQLDTTGKELDYCEKVVDYINNLSVGKTPIIDVNNKLSETEIGLKVYNANETFVKDEWVVGFVEGKKGIYNSLIPNNIGNALTDATAWEEVKIGGGGSGFNLFDTKLSDHILEGDEAKGWALQGTYVYKEAVAGVRDGYPDFYEKVVEEYQNSEIKNYKQYRSSNVTKYSNLIDDKGVLSGFSTVRYATLPEYFAPSSNPWEFVTKITTGDFSDINMIIGNTTKFKSGIALFIGEGGVYALALSSNGTSWGIANDIKGSTLLANTEYWFKVEFTGTEYNAYYSTNGVDWIKDITVASTTAIYQNAYNWVLGSGLIGGDTWYLGTHSLDLNESYININGERWWTGCNYYEFDYKTNSNGHSFYDMEQKDKVDEVFNVTGLAWLYGVDTENERIFLPRNVWFEQMAINTSQVGNSVNAGLPNITGTFKADRHTASANPTGAFSVVPNSGTTGADDTGTSQTIYYEFNASVSNSIYGNSDTVQPNAIKKLLYICVGNTNVESAITDIVDVTTTENDTMPLFTGMYFDFTPNNASWLKAGEQANSGGVYTTCYNELVNCLNGTNPYNLKVINIADMVSGVDYSEYWKVNQDEMYFVCPTKLSYGALTGGVLGNGKTMGITDGTTDYALAGGLLSSYRTILGTGEYTETVGQSINVQALQTNTSLGLSTDQTKSGIIAEQSTAELYFKVANAVQNLELLNVGEVMEAVADKISRQDCVAYVTETFRDGSSWYRVYSDGWCEQGGRSSATSTLVVVNLLKPFIDTNYSVITTGLYDGGNTANAWDYVRNFTTSTFSIYQQEDGCVWEAKGYIS